MTSQRLLKAFAGSYKEEKQCWIQDFVWGLSKYFAKAAYKAYKKSRLVYQCHPKHSNLNMTYAGRKSTYQTQYFKIQVSKTVLEVIEEADSKRMKTFSSENFRPWWIGGLVCWFGILGVALERKCCLAISLESRATEPQPTDEATGEALPGSLVLRSSHSSVGATTGQYSIATHAFGGMSRTYV